MAEQVRYLQVIDLLNSTREQLRALYASGAAPALLRQRKHETFAAARESYEALKATWGAHAPFDAWFAEDINNAHLASISTYYRCVPGFQRELQAARGSLPAFYRRVRALAKLEKRQRDEVVCGTALTARQRSWESP